MESTVRSMPCSCMWLELHGHKCGRCRFQFVKNASSSSTSHFLFFATLSVAPFCTSTPCNNGRHHLAALPPILSGRVCVWCSDRGESTRGSLFAPPPLYLPTEIKHFWIKFAFSFSPHFFNFFYFLSREFRVCHHRIENHTWRVLISNRERDTLIGIEEKVNQSWKKKDYWLDGTHKIQTLKTQRFGQKSAPLKSQTCQLWSQKRTEDAKKKSNREMYSLGLSAALDPQLSDYSDGKWCCQVFVVHATI